MFLAIAKRLKAPPEHGYDHVLEWQVDRMNQLRMYNRETIQILSQYTGLAESEIDKAVQAVGFDTAKDIDALILEASDGRDAPKTSIDTLMTGLAAGAKGDLNNMVNAYLITGVVNGRYQTGEAQRQYVDILNNTVAQVLAGNQTINQAVTKSIIAAKAKGMYTGFIDKGGRRWRMEHYAETVARSTVNRVYRDVSMARMDEFDINLIRISSHINARPICAQIQGRVASIKEYDIGEYPSIYNYGYGTPGGIGGKFLMPPNDVNHITHGCVTLTV